MTDTILVRRPTATPAGEVRAPVFRPRPADRRRARRHPHRQGVAIVAAHRRGVGRVPPPRRRDHHAGRDRRHGRPNRRQRPQAHRGARRHRRVRDRRPRYVRFVHDVHDQGLGRRRGEGEAGRRDRHRGVRGARPQRRHASRPRRPQGARAAVPARGATRGGAAGDRRRVLPAGARSCWVRRDRADGRTGRGQRRPARAVRARAGRALERRRAAAARDRRRDRSAARGHAVPGRSRAVRAAAGQRRGHDRADRDQRGDGRRGTGGVPDRHRRAGGDLRAGVERLRAHDHDVERVPDAARQRAAPRRPRHRLPSRAAWAAPPDADR